MVIDQIRSATNSRHEALEKAMQPHLMRIESNDQYARLLHFFYGYFQPVYEKINQFIPLHFLPDYAERRKPSAILHDLEAIEHGNIATTPLICQDLPDIHDAASAFGALYVLEGSTLGGKMISRMIGGKIPLTPENGLEFFFSYGPVAGSMWKKFLAAMETFAEAEGQHETIIKTANDTFIKFKKWIDEQSSL